MTEHIKETHNPTDECRDDVLPGTCHTCNLFICSVCGGCEGSLLPSCPGHKLTCEEHEANYQYYCDGTGPFEGRKR